MTPEERNAELEAENAALREQVRALLERVQELEARRAKDSHNSSKPPSSDGLKRKTKSLRTKSGKKPGGQLGHRGETLRLVAVPDAVVEHRPSHCPQCQTPLADAEVVLRERRQVHEVPPGVRLQIREHRALHVRCPTCAQVSVGTFPAEAPSRAQYGAQVRALAVYLVEQQHLPLGRVQQLLSDLWRLRLGRGTRDAGELDPAGGAGTGAGRAAHQGRAYRRVGPPSRRDRRSASRGAGVGARDEYESAHALRHPPQTRT